MTRQDNHMPDAEGHIRQIAAWFNPVFAQTHLSKQRYICCKGSAGSGKSVDTAQWLLLKIVSTPGVNLMCVRKIYESNRLSTFAELCSAIGRLGLSEYFSITASPCGIRCKNGNQIVFAGCRDDTQRDKLKSITLPGGKLTDIWIEEATELSRSDFEIIDDRLRGELPPGLFYQIRLTFNPVSDTHWIKRDFFDRVSPDVLCCHSTYLDNLYCDEAYHRRMERRRQTDPDGYRIYGLGEWGEIGGLILPNIEIAPFETDAAQFDAVSIGQDFGFNHCNAILALGYRDGNIYVRDEIVVNGMDTGGIIALAREKNWFDGVTMLCDCAEPDRILTWNRAGFRAVGCYKAAGSVKNEIDWLRQRVIYIHPDCINTIAEIQKWHWSRDKNGSYTDVPVPFEDDAMAALRYGCQPFMRRKERREKEAELPVNSKFVGSFSPDNQVRALGRGGRRRVM